MIGRKWCSKRGRFPFLGGRSMFRREMGSKRGSLPPKEGDLTCMDAHEFAKKQGMTIRFMCVSTLFGSLEMHMNLPRNKVWQSDLCVSTLCGSLEMHTSLPRNKVWQSDLCVFLLCTALWRCTRICQETRYDNQIYVCFYFVRFSGDAHEFAKKQGMTIRFGYVSYVQFWLLRFCTNLILSYFMIVFWSRKFPLCKNSTILTLI